MSRFVALGVLALLSIGGSPRYGVPVATKSYGEFKDFPDYNRPDTSMFARTACSGKTPYQTVFKWHFWTPTEKMRYPADTPGKGCWGLMATGGKYLGWSYPNFEGSAEDVYTVTDCPPPPP